jgi:hypothetical protein
MARSTKRQTRKPIAAAPASSGRPSEREFNPDYSYVIKDLKRIGSLAGIFFVILVALSFIIR